MYIYSIYVQMICFQNSEKHVQFIEEVVEMEIKITFASLRFYEHMSHIQGD